MSPDEVTHTADVELGSVVATMQEMLPGLHRLARQRLGSSDDSEDVVSDVFANVLARLREGKPAPSDLKGYLAVSVRNRCTDLLRSGERSRATSTDFSDESAQQAYLLDEAPVDTREARAYVAQALDCLSADHRRALLHVYVDGRKPGELAAALGRSGAAVSSLLVRAKKELRLALARTIVGSPTPECEAFVRGLGADSPILQPGANLRPPHCPRCASPWRTYWTLLGVFGLLPLLVLGQRVRAVSATAEAQPRRLRRARKSELREGTVPGSAATRLGRLRASWVQTPLALVVSIALAAVGAAELGVAAMQIPRALPDGTASLDAPATPDPSSSISAEFPPGEASAGEGDPVRADPLRADVRVVATMDGDSTVLSVDFVSEQPDLLFRSLELRLPPGVTVDVSPPGWACIGSEVALCQAEEVTEIGTFLLAGPAPYESSYSLTVTGHCLAGDITARAVGQFPPLPE